jgi:hypothetical protein
MRYYFSNKSQQGRITATNPVKPTTLHNKHLNHQRIDATIVPRTQSPDQTAPTESPTTVDAQPYINNQEGLLSPTELVDRILLMIKDTNAGENVKPELRKVIDRYIMTLEAIGATQLPRPLVNPNLWGNCNVAYVSTGANQYGQPAGGRFRTGFGKIFFTTTGLFQSLFSPNIAVNKVQFLLFGCIPGFIGLRGYIKSIPEKENSSVDNQDTAKVFFDSPVLSLVNDRFSFKIGPPSSVILKTTYVDDRVRLGKGSRGSLFVFTKGGESDAAGMEEVGVSGEKPLSMMSRAILVGLTAFFLGNAAFLMFNGSAPLPVRGAGCISLLLGISFARTFFQGGIIDPGADDRPSVPKPEGA